MPWRAGGFSALTGSAGLFNGSVASSSGGVTDLPNASPDGKVMAYSGGVGGSLLPWRYGVNVSTTHYSQPINVGKYWMFPQDIPFFLAKQVCQ